MDILNTLKSIRISRRKQPACIAGGFKKRPLKKIVFIVDHKEGWGGEDWLKIKELRKIISGFGSDY